MNPLTAVGFLHTVQQNGHKAIVHTAAGSQLSRMLVKYCNQLNGPLVNIARREAAVAALKELGAEHIVNSSLDTYKECRAPDHSRGGRFLGWVAHEKQRRGLPLPHIYREPACEGLHGVGGSITDAREVPVHDGEHVRLSKALVQCCARRCV